MNRGILGPVDATQKFSDRVEEYARCRPGYPAGVYDLLTHECGLGKGSVVADVGSGTGIFAEGLLESGATVFGVEPNDKMRAAAAERLPRLVSVNATAEQTSLQGFSVDIVTCAQSFHWFDAAAAIREFIRILKPGGWVVLVWNERLEDATPFMAEYQRALETHCPDYKNAQHREKSEEDIRAVFAPNEMRTAAFPNQQLFDFDGLVGRSFSSSYAPSTGTPEHGPFMAALKQLFDEHNANGEVAFLYETRVYFGHLGVTPPPSPLRSS